MPDTVHVTPELRKHRALCPKCARKGLGFANHPHAYGWRDYSRARCRYCEARFPIVSPEEAH